MHRRKNNADVQKDNLTTKSDDKPTVYNPKVKPQTKQPTSKLSTTALNCTDATSTTPFPSIHSMDAFFSILVFFMAAFPRFFRISYPNYVVFDEIHFGKFVFHHLVLNQSFFFDVFPPLGKMILAIPIFLMRYDPSDLYFAYDTVQGQYPDKHPYGVVRQVAGIFGSLACPLMYVVERELNISEVPAFIAALLLALDNMSIITSRMMMVDSIMIFFMLASLLAAIKMWKTKNLLDCIGKGGEESKKSYKVRLVFWMWLSMTGILCGSQVAIKWTAFFTPLFIFFVSMLGIAPFLPSRPLSVWQLVVFIITSVSTYMGIFGIFLMMTGNSGSGDGFMSAEFQATLVGNAHRENSEVIALNLIQKVVELNRVMVTYNKGIRGEHPWGSTWYQWVINWRGVLYYRAPEGQDMTRIIYMLMNPFMSFFVFFCIVLFLLTALVFVRYRVWLSSVQRERISRHLGLGMALSLGWFLSVLPTMVFYRSGPVYQYQPALMFAQLLTGSLVDTLPGRGKLVMMFMVATGMLIGFVYWSPWIYADPLTETGHEHRRWLPRWN